jgi:hypothetical protein
MAEVYVVWRARCASSTMTDEVVAASTLSKA